VPFPVSLVVKKGSKTLGSASAGIPGPLSSMMIYTTSRSGASVLRTQTSLRRDCSRASAALSMMFTTTRFICSESTCTIGKSGVRSRCREIPFRRPANTFRASSRISLICAGAGREAGKRAALGWPPVANYGVSSEPDPSRRVAAGIWRLAALLCSPSRLRTNYRNARLLLRFRRDAVREFDARYYLRMHPDVARSGIPALLHYVFIGFKEGRNPSWRFDTRGYLAKHPEVARSGCNPLLHSILGKSS